MTYIDERGLLRTNAGRLLEFENENHADKEFLREVERRAGATKRQMLEVLAFQEKHGAGRNVIRPWLRRILGEEKP